MAVRENGQPFLFYGISGVTFEYFLLLGRESGCFYTIEQGIDI